MRHLRRPQLWMIAGVGCFVLLTWMNRPGLWQPATVALTAGENRIAAQLDPGVRYEISIEVTEEVAPKLRRELLLAGMQQQLQGQWQVDCGAGPVAHGELSDYRRVAQVRPLLGRLRRAILRVPFGQDRLSYWTLGLLGSFVGERSVGAFSVDEEVSCGVSLRISVWPDNLSPGLVSLVVRRDDAEWRAHYERVVVLAGAGVLCFGIALSAWLGRFWQSRRRRDVA